MTYFFSLIRDVFNGVLNIFENTNIVIIPNLYTSNLLSLIYGGITISCLIGALAVITRK